MLCSKALIKNLKDNAIEYVQCLVILITISLTPDCFCIPGRNENY